MSDLIVMDRQLLRLRIRNDPSERKLRFDVQAEASELGNRLASESAKANSIPVEDVITDMELSRCRLELDHIAELYSELKGSTEPSLTAAIESARIGVDHGTMTAEAAKEVVDLVCVALRPKPKTSWFDRLKNRK